MDPRHNSRTRCCTSQTFSQPFHHPIRNIGTSRGLVYPRASHEDSSIAYSNAGESRERSARLFWVYGLVINAESGQLDSSQKQMSGNATNSLLKNSFLLQL